MDNKALQKTFDLSDEQISRLREQHGDWNGTEFVPTQVPLISLIRLTIIDAVGE